MRKDFFDYFGEEVEDQIEAISTGCPSLDMCIGVDGVPKRRFTEIYGEESTGKSTLALSVAKTCLTNGGKVMYVDAEHQMSMPYIKSIVGEFDKNQMRMVRPQTAEDAFKSMEYGIGEDSFNLIILDSVASLAPLQEIKKEFDEDSMALTSRSLNKFFRRQAYAVREKAITVIFINQVRDTIGSYFKSFSTPGGHALKHYTSVRISLTRSKKIKQGEEHIGNYIKASIVKNKVSTPHKSTVLPLIFGKGFDGLLDLISVAEILGVILKSGSFYKYDGTSIGQGALAVKETLLNNPELLDKIKRQCYNMREMLKGEEGFTEDD